MCGIVGYVGTRSCGPILIEGLRRLEYRGYDSAGVAIHDGHGVQRRRAEGKLSNLEQLFWKEPIEGATGIGHTRWATHGRPSERNAHPHRHGSIIVVHNGIIENHASIREELEAEGHIFESETDTEIIAHLVSRERERSSDLLDAVGRSLARVRGSWALVVLDENEPDHVVAARNASPLVVGLGDDENFAASDVPAILMHTRDVVFLEDGDLVDIRRDAVRYFDAERQPVARESKRILWDPVSAEKQGFKHFMLKEIHEQPTRIVDTLRGRISHDDDRVELAELGLTPERVAEIGRIVILACGTSWHAGLVGKYAIEQIARIPVEIDLASEYRYRQPIVDPRTLVIAISQSGETADTLAAVREAQRLGARAIAICNAMQSSLARVCEATLYTHAGPEIGVASTKAFTTQLAALYLVAMSLGQARGTLADARRGELLRALRTVPRLMEEALAHEDTIRELAKGYIHASSFLFLGRGPQFPIALEGALKLKEISYIHAEGYAAGEMKHGPIALIDEDLPIVMLAPQGAHFEKAASNLQEVKARGGRVIAVTTGTGHELDAWCEHVIRVPEIDELLQPLLTIVPLQMLAYHVADLKGTDVDQPRNLAKSVTVE